MGTKKNKHWSFWYLTILIFFLGCGGGSPVMILLIKIYELQGLPLQPKILKKYGFCITKKLLQASNGIQEHYASEWVSKGVSE